MTAKQASGTLQDVKKKQQPDSSIRSAAQSLGRLGGTQRLKNIGPQGFAKLGRKGGKARLKSMSKAQRTAIARKAAEARVRKYGLQSRKKESQ